MNSQVDKKYLIVNADDFGMSIAHNNAVMDGFLNGFLTSACICANGDGFAHSINEILPACKRMGIGAHLNIIEGKTVRVNFSRSSLLYDSEGAYKRGFLYYLLNASNKFLINEIEADYREQIEKILQYTALDHVNSHVHTHAVPVLFEIVCKLAQEYKIPYVRTQYEKFYTTSSVKKHLNTWYPANLAKIAVLNSCTVANLETAKKYGIKTNNYLIGVGYTSFMDSDTVECGLNAIKDKTCLTEVLIHPCKYDSPVSSVYEKARLAEYKITMDLNLCEKIHQNGWNLTNYATLESVEQSSLSSLSQ